MVAQPIFIGATAAFVFQYAIGAMIDLFPAAATGGYPPDAYRFAFGALLAAEILGLLWYLAHWQRMADADKIVLAAYRARSAPVIDKP